MIKHIKDLTKVIQKQTEYAESSIRRFASLDRIIANLTSR